MRRIIPVVLRHPGLVPEPVRLALVGCVVALLGSWQVAPASAQADVSLESPSTVEGVVYTTLRPPNLDIFLFDPDGSRRRLTRGPELDYNAIFSPDGRWVVFTSEREGSADLFALDLAGEKPPVALTRHSAFDDQATFSPDGERLAFVSSRSGNADIFVMDFDPADPALAEAEAVNLTLSPGGDFNPAFSPDGHRMAFARQSNLWPLAISGPPDYPGLHSDVFVMRSDGTGVERLSEPGAISGSPAWSHDGDAVFYYRLEIPLYDQSSQEQGGLAIRRIAMDGTGDEAFASFGLSPTPVPGGRLAFVRLRPAPTPDLTLAQGHIVSVAPDGSDLRAETDSTRSCFAPAYAPGGQSLLCHGPAPVEDGVTMRGAYNGYPGELFPFAPPGAQRQVELPDRTLQMSGMRGYFPAVLPDGAIVYSPLQLRFGGATVPLEAANVDGSGARVVFAVDSAVAWGAAAARNEGRIVTAVGPVFAGGETAVDLWTLRPDGSEPRNLTPGARGNDALPHVSADGRVIVFRAEVGDTSKVFVMDGDGGNRRRVTSLPGDETMPAVSPDGEWVVFSTSRTGTRKLWLQRLDGTEGRFLEADRMDVPDGSMHARFSPDGRWVIFTSDRGQLNDEWPHTWFSQPYGDLWAVPVAGGPAMRLTDDKWEDGPNDWGFIR